MEYIFSKNRSTPHDLVMELRINLIRVNNAFCEKQMEVCGNWALDLVYMFESTSVDLNPILPLAFEIEGVLDAIDDDTLAKEVCEELVERLKKEMDKLPLN